MLISDVPAGGTASTPRSESEGRPRNAVSPDVYAEDFSAAVDFLGTQALVDRDRVGVLGI